MRAIFCVAVSLASSVFCSSAYSLASGINGVVDSYNEPSAQRLCAQFKKRMELVKKVDPENLVIRQADKDGKYRSGPAEYNPLSIDDLIKNELSNGSVTCLADTVVVESPGMGIGGGTATQVYSPTVDGGKLIKSMIDSIDFPLGNSHYELKFVEDAHGKFKYTEISENDVLNEPKIISVDNFFEQLDRSTVCNFNTDQLGEKGVKSIELPVNYSRSIIETSLTPKGNEKFLFIAEMQDRLSVLRTDKEDVTLTCNKYGFVFYRN